MKLLGNKDLRKGRITRQEVHCLGTWSWTRGWGELSEEVPRWAVGADPLVWQGESCIDCNKEMATFIILRKCCPFTKISFSRGLAVLGILVSGVCIAPVAYAYFGPAGQYLNCLNCFKRYKQCCFSLNFEASEFSITHSP